MSSDRNVTYVPNRSNIRSKSALVTSAGVTSGAEASEPTDLMRPA